jgi:hypothetical protein
MEIPMIHDDALSAQVAAEPQQDNPVVAVLREARRLIAEVGWTQGAYARDAVGTTISPAREDATCFCMEGALRRASRDRGLFDAAEGVILDKCGELTIPSFNDAPDRTKDEVLSVLDRAIAAAEAGEVAL